MKKSDKRKQTEKELINMIQDISNFLNTYEEYLNKKQKRRFCEVLYSDGQIWEMEFKEKMKLIKKVKNIKDEIKAFRAAEKEKDGQQKKGRKILEFKQKTEEKKHPLKYSARYIKNLINRYENEEFEYRLKRRKRWKV